MLCHAVCVGESSWSGPAFPVIQQWFQVPLEGQRIDSPDPTAVPVGVLQEGFFLFFLLICSYLATIHNECSSQRWPHFRGG